MLNKINKIYVKERYKICESIFNIFKCNCIPYAVVKGAVLSKMAYGDIYHRKSSDIDILIRHKDIDIIKQIMLENNFIQGYLTNEGLIPYTRSELVFQTANSHQMAPFIKKTNNPLHPYVNVDINFDIIWGESKLKSDMDYVLSHIDFIEICGITVNKLSPEMEFIALCLHHYKDMNSIYMLSRGSLTKDLFDDIYNYLKNVKLNKENLLKLCNYLNIIKYVYYCIYYTNKLFNDSFFYEYIELLYIDGVEDILNTYGLAYNEIKEWDFSFHDRLHNLNINDYFNTHLSKNELEKIRINNVFMN